MIIMVIVVIVPCSRRTNKCRSQSTRPLLTKGVVNTLLRPLQGFFNPLSSPFFFQSTCFIPLQYLPPFLLLQKGFFCFTLTQQCRNDLSHHHQLLLRRWENVSTGLVRDRATAFYLHQVQAHCKTIWILRVEQKFPPQNFDVGILDTSILLTYEIIPQSTSHVQVERVLAFLPPPPLEGEPCAPCRRKNAPLPTLHTANEPAY